MRFLVLFWHFLDFFVRFENFTCLFFFTFFVDLYKFGTFFNFWYFDILRTFSYISTFLVLFDILRTFQNFWYIFRFLHLKKFLVVIYSFGTFLQLLIGTCRHFGNFFLIVGKFWDFYIFGTSLQFWYFFLISGTFCHFGNFL